MVLLEATQGYEFITGDHLTQNEADMKVVTAVIQAISVVATGGGALAASGGKGGATALGKALAAMFISDLAAGSTAVLGNTMDLPPVLTAIFALAAGVGSGKLANDWLFGSTFTTVDLDSLGDDIARVAKENNMTPDELIKILQKEPGNLTAAQATLVDDVFKNTLGSINMDIRLNYTATSGVELTTTSGRTTTILGTYADDTKNILDELDLPKSTDFSGNPNGFNLLNTPDELYVTPSQFWEEYNRPWLDNVIERNDVILLATEPTNAKLYRVNYITGQTELTGFGREFQYLLDNGFVYDAATGSMIKP